MAGGAGTSSAWIRPTSRECFRPCLLTWRWRSNLGHRRVGDQNGGTHMSTNAVQQPAAGDDLTLVQPSRTHAAGAGVTWISEGWKLFAKAPLMWIVALIILFVMAIIAGFIPIIGSIAFQIVNPVFAAGMFVACRALGKGGEFELEHAFAGFRSPRLMSLVILGAIFLVAWLAIVVVCMGAFGLSVGAAILT